MSWLPRRENQDQVDYWKELVVELIAYYRQLVGEQPEDRGWQIGLDTALDWQRLLQADSISDEEVAAFLNSMNDENKDLGSGWILLVQNAFLWARLCGFKTPKFRIPGVVPD